MRCELCIADLDETAMVSHGEFFVCEDCDDRDTVKARIAELEAALLPFAKYANARQAQPLHGMGDTVHAIHTGTPFAAEITLADCIAARAALAKQE